MRHFKLPFLLSLTTLAACSGSSTSALTDPGTDGGIADASTATDTGASGDASVDNRIDPIALGRSWTYDVTITGTYPLCKAGSHTGSVLGQKTVGGKPAFQIQSYCPGAGTSSYAVDGDKVEIFYGGTWVLSLDSPVSEGHTWSDGTYGYVWEKAGNVSVGAKLYADCWKATVVGGESYTTLCRGVGPVRFHFLDLDGNGFDATLTAVTL